MRFQVRRIAAAAAALLVTLAVLFGAQRWLFQTQTSTPLQQALQKTAGVQRVSLDFAQSPGTVEVTLGRVADLETTYQALSRRVQALASGATIVVRGSPDGRLDAAAQDLSFSIAQGLATGQFVAMRQDVLAGARRDGVEARIYIDQQNVYLALYDPAHVAYYIYPREAK